MISSVLLLKKRIPLICSYVRVIFISFSVLRFHIFLFRLARVHFHLFFYFIGNDDVFAIRSDRYVTHRKTHIFVFLSSFIRHSIFLSSPFAFSRFSIPKFTIWTWSDFINRKFGANETKENYAMKFSYWWIFPFRFAVVHSWFDRHTHTHTLVTNIKRTMKICKMENR